MSINTYHLSYVNSISTAHRRPPSNNILCLGMAIKLVTNKTFHQMSTVNFNFAYGITVLELEKPKRNHIKANIHIPLENINISITIIRGTYPSLSTYG